MNRWMIIFHWGWCYCWWTRCLIWRREISGCAETSKTSYSSSSKPRMETPSTGATDTRALSRTRWRFCCSKLNLCFCFIAGKLWITSTTWPRLSKCLISWRDSGDDLMHTDCFLHAGFWFVFWLDFLTLAETLTGQTGSSPRRRPAETKAYAWGRESPPRLHSWASCQVHTHTHTHTSQPESYNTEYTDMYVLSQLGLGDMSKKSYLSYHIFWLICSLRYMYLSILY